MLPRSYVFSLERRALPSELIAVPLPAGGLSISPGYTCETQISGRSFVALIGYCIDLRRADLGTREVAASLLATGLREGVSAILAEVDDLLGRFTAICHLDGTWTVFSDAGATRTTYYAEDTPLIASHSVLIGSLIGRPSRVQLFRHACWGLPGNASPVPGVRLLPANFALDLSTRTPFRFWPRSRRAERSVGELAEPFADVLTRSAAAIAFRWKSAVSLTAGIDSRTTLAAFRHLPNVSCFTYDRGGADTHDAIIAGRISDRLGIPHRRLRIPKSATSVALSDYKHVAALPGLYPVWFPVDGYVHVRSNLAEIGRAFWRKSNWVKLKGHRPLVGNTAMWVDLLFRKELEGEPLRSEAKRYIEEEMARFVGLLRYEGTEHEDASLLGYDGWDLIYWEHRMTTWHGPLVLGSDGCFDTAVIFNSRRALELMLSAPLADRLESTLFRRLIDDRCPGLHDLPFNPQPLVDLPRLISRIQRAGKHAGRRVTQRLAAHRRKRIQPS